MSEFDIVRLDATEHGMHAATNEHMIAIDEAIGYRVGAHGSLFQKHLAR
ncbi:hypothetical protein L0U85_18215 [Glycomyces sp. L485]|nr:hypothetical protein [Glycomyces sp. L485]MCH7232771.1 hypothetical protein [Glycomyces sp. L485]